MKIETIHGFKCKICGCLYDTPAEAIACHDSHPPPNHIEMSHICAERKEECIGESCHLSKPTADAHSEITEDGNT